MDAVKEMGQIIKQTALLTADRDSLGCAKLVVFCQRGGRQPPSWRAPIMASVRRKKPSMSVSVAPAWSRRRWKRSGSEV